MRVRNTALSIGQQAARMMSDFPGFQYSRRGGIPTWQGTLQPDTNSREYQIKIVYRRPKSPRVWVLQPELAPKAPHRYHDNSLCLYFPNDGSWKPERFISETIVGWTALWLAFYEIWLGTGVWYGPEAPHVGRKKG